MYKGPRAQAETIRRRPYHRKYYESHRSLAKMRGKRRLIPCPTCDHYMNVGQNQERCWRCRAAEGRHEVCACGQWKSRDAKQCWRCRGWRKSPNARGTVARSAHEINPFCPNSSTEGAATCETRRPHHHCACGLPCPPDKFFCRVCLFEQARIEFKTWPIEDWEAA